VGISSTDRAGQYHGQNTPTFVLLVTGEVVANETGLELRTAALVGSSQTLCPTLVIR
jgi:hypothetical protein